MCDLGETKTLLKIIELYEDDEVCDSSLLIAETGFSRTEVDEILDNLWRADLIECRAMRVDGDPILTGIRRVLPDRERRRGGWGRYQDQPE